MSSTTVKKQSTPNKSVSTSQKVIKPLNPSEFDINNVEYTNKITNTEYGFEWVNVHYKNPNSKEKQLRVVARKCVIKSFGKAEVKDDGKKPKKGKDEKPKHDKFQAWLDVKDEAFIEMMKTFEDSLLETAVEKSKEWFDDEMTESECLDMRRSAIAHSDKYGYSISATLSNDFTCKSKTEDVPDVSDLTQALAKKTVVDICFNITKVKLSKMSFRLGLEISQINIISVGGGSEEYVSTAITPEEFKKGNIKISERKQHEKGGRFCKVLYEEKPLRVRLENVGGRIFKFEKEGQCNYSICIRLADAHVRKMFEDIDEELFNLILANSKELYDGNSKKTAKQLKNILKPLVSYGKTDVEKMKEGKKPEFDPSIWIKLYYSEEKGFDGKIVNVDNNTPFDKAEDIVNKDVNITSIEFFSRHVWFGPKGTSTNLTLNKCQITYDVPVYDMDDAEDNDAEESEQEEEEEAAEEAEESEAENSDDDE
jgi:hypothetical protein